LSAEQNAFQKMNFQTRNMLAGALFALFFSACQDVIDLDLDAADQQIVIEGIITDQPGKHRVQITKSVPFDLPNQFPAVTGAFVTIADGAGLLDTLSESAPGIYETQKLTQGIAARTYTLQVATAGKIFTARSTMPVAVPFDNLTAKPDFGGDFSLVTEFKDPVGLGNFYNFSVFVNGERKPSIFTLNDELIDGNLVKRTLFEPDLELLSGDSVTVEMFCLDPVEYKYLLTLELILGGGPIGGSTPSNPDNNFGGACLGHFSAHTVQARSVVIP